MKGRRRYGFNIGEMTLRRLHIRAPSWEALTRFAARRPRCGLGRHADPRALDQLLALLDDPEWRVVEAALKALRRYRDPRIVAAAQAVCGAQGLSFLGISRVHCH